MERLIPLALFWLALPIGAQDTPTDPPSLGPLPEVEDSQIGYESPQAALEALTAKPGVEVRTNQGWTIINDQSGRTLWTFTPETHPAHPAVVKRTVQHRDGAIFLDMKVKCFGTKTACDALVRDFQALNDKVQNEMRNSKP
ncbi:MAG: molecular chaperone DnaJ [Steroidobacteraceae bacterium]